MTRQSVLSILALLLGLAMASPASAQSGTAARTWLSGAGTDSGTCPFTAPCRTLAYVISVVEPKGQIVLLDPVGYGPVTISHSVSILSEGHFSFINAASGNGITINAGPSDIVVLRGITVDGVGSGTHGILLNSGGALSMVNCIAQNFTFDGVLVAPASGATKVDISNTIASGNSGNGIDFNPGGSATVKGTISQTTANNNGMSGIVVFGSSTATVVDSVASNNFDGFATAAGGVMRLGRSVASANSTGIPVGGTTYSYGDNKIDGNLNEVSGSLTSLASR